MEFISLDLDCIPEDLENLVDFRIARKQWLAGAHLSKDSTTRPHVDASGILTAAEENLRRAVPKGDNLVRHLVPRQTT